MRPIESAIDPILAINTLAEEMRSIGFRITFGHDVFGQVAPEIFRPSGKIMFIPSIETPEDCLRVLQWSRDIGLRLDEE